MAKLHLAQQLIDILWPVGSVYISTDAANPSTKFGGTWSQITGGFIYGTTATSGGKGGTGNTGTGTSTGKASGNTGSTVLTAHNLPGSAIVREERSGTTNAGNDHWSSGLTGWGNYENGYGKSDRNQGHTHTLNSHQHTIPYIECYVWKRTA